VGVHTEDDAPCMCYDPTIIRHREGPEELLSGWSGFLHSDRYSGYDNLFLGDTGGISEVACCSPSKAMSNGIILNPVLMSTICCFR
jgi:hypothetical protein